MSPSAKVKHWLEEQGYFVAKVERWIPQAKRRIDAYGIGDFLAFKPSEQGAILVQATSYSNISSHRHKINDNPLSRLWLQAGNRIMLIGTKEKEVKMEEIK